MRKWQCSVCGYIHTGDEPPEKCPVCGAPREKFVEITDPAEDREISEAPVETTSFEPPETGAPDRRSLLYESITDKMVVLHAHPISVHIPNGVLPVSVLFLFIAAVFQLEALGRAAFYNMIIVFLAMPFVLFSGYNDWKKRLGGNMTNIVLTKMICGGTVLTLSFVLVLWWILDPGVLTGGAHRGLFMFLNIVLLAAAVVAGYMGGKLVFKDPK